MIELVEEKDIQSCFTIMHQLRTHLSETEFLQHVKCMYQEGYRLVKLTDAGTVKAVMGFRIYTNLHLGRNLYIDDLVTDSNARSQGYGAALMQWTCAYARQNACLVVHLDSGIQRHKAHKFYLNQNMDIVSYHFSKPIKP